jgi:hypothetical protein
MTLTRTNIRFTASGLEVPAVTAELMREARSKEVYALAAAPHTCGSPRLFLLRSTKAPAGRDSI